MNIDDIIKNFSKQEQEIVPNTPDLKSEQKAFVPSSELLMDIFKEVFHIDEEIFTELALEEQNKLVTPDHPDQNIFSEDSKIITGPDGTKWLVEKSGLWINLDEANSAEVIKNHNQYSLELRTHYVDHSDELYLSAHVKESEEHENPTLILEVFIPHHSTFVLTNEKNVIDSYLYLNLKSLQIDSIGDIKIESQYIPTCKFHSSSHSTQVSLNTAPSTYYKFDRPSKLHATCSNELIVGTPSGTSMCPKSENQTKCSYYESDTWKTTHNLIGSSETFSIQQRRYGNGTYRYRLYDNLSSSVVLADTDESITSKNEGNIYCSFEIFQKFVSEWIEENNFSLEIIKSNQEKTDIEMVYTQYVANA
jgi:hypothetical protein